MITLQMVRDQIMAYLNRSIPLSQLVDWAEDVMNEGVFEAQHADLLRDVVARIGLADVKAFGLSWDDCYDFLSRLGFRVHVMAT